MLPPDFSLQVSATRFIAWVMRSSAEDVLPKLKVTTGSPDASLPEASLPESLLSGGPAGGSLDVLASPPQAESASTIASASTNARNLSSFLSIVDASL